MTFKDIMLRISNYVYSYGPEGVEKFKQDLLKVYVDAGVSTKKAVYFVDFLLDKELETGYFDVLSGARELLDIVVMDNEES